MNIIKEVHQVPFDEKLKLKYLFLENKRRGSKTKTSINKELAELCNENKYKQQKTIEILQEIINKKEKVVICPSFTSTLLTLDKLLVKNNLISYAYFLDVSGTVSQYHAEKNINIFNEDDSKLILLTTRVIQRSISNNQIKHLLHYDTHFSKTTSDRNHFLINPSKDQNERFIHFIHSEGKMDHQCYLEYVQWKSQFIDSL